MIPEAVWMYIDHNYERSIADLSEFLRIPGISTVKAYDDDVRRAAGWLQERIKKLGFDVTLYETSGHPIVYAEMCPHPDRLTLMFYAHYDVAPPGLLEEWKTPPFSPVLIDNQLFARGAVDDKCQLFTILQALEAILVAGGRLPVNVKLLFEGEEEAGQPEHESVRGRARADAES